MKLIHICWCCGYPRNKKGKCYGNRINEPCRIYNTALAECSTPYTDFRKGGICKGKVKGFTTNTKVKQKI